METIKIALQDPNESVGTAYRSFTKKRVQALDKIYNRVIPKWYRNLIDFAPVIFSHFVTVQDEYISNKHEVVKIYFFGMEREEIHFYYY